MADSQLIGGTQQGAGVSPGGFEFGVQGWNWGDPRPTSITFFLDNTAMVCDQHGRPIRGVVDTTTNKDLKFAMSPPIADRGGDVAPRPQFATHEQVVKALDAERINWQSLECAGWPQLSYKQLKEMKEMPATPPEELEKIKGRTQRRDALKVRREWDDVRLKESQGED